MIPCSVSMSFSVVPCSSSPSNPDSKSTLNIVAAFMLGALDMIASACSLVGAIGTLELYL